MASSSPAEFLTFMRHIAVRSRTAIPPASSRPRQISLASTRPFSSSPIVFMGDKDKEHANVKKDQLDVQSEQVGKAKSAHSSGGTDNSTSGGDSSNSAAKAKKEHPEAPDTIGMQDERGGKGAY